MDPKNRKSLNDMNVRSTTKKMNSKLIWKIFKTAIAILPIFF